MITHLGPYELGPGGEKQGVYTGDSRELARLIPNESVDCVITDPPFGIGFKYSHSYKDDPGEYPALMSWLVETCRRVIKPGGLCFVFVAQPRLRKIWPLFPEDSRIFAACKNFVQMRKIPVQFSYDPVIFWRKDGEPLKKMSGRDYHVANTSVSSRRGLASRKGLVDVSWFPCPRPLDEIIYMVENFCPLGGVIWDGFMGSGTLGVAAKITGCHWVGFEIDGGVAERSRERIRGVPESLPGINAEQGEMDLS